IASACVRSTEARSWRSAVSSACRCWAARRPGSASNKAIDGRADMSAPYKPHSYILGMFIGETMSRFQVRKVAVLGAGVMGAQIAAHLVNVKVPVVLFDLPAKEGPKNGIVTRAIDNLKKLKPAPLADVADAVLIEQANYEEHLDKLKECDLIIEAIAERMDWKLDLYKRIASAIAPHAIV